MLDQNFLDKDNEITSITPVSDTLDICYCLTRDNMG